MPTTTILIQDATASERRLLKGMLDLVKRRRRTAARIANNQNQVTADTAVLAEIDADLFPALESVFSARGIAPLTDVELLLDVDTGKPDGLALTHP